jgi:class 3 adenylate cyclase/tetratricopeptide (TPR) repeat protein
MQCPRCQHENRQGRRFCAECGASLALACSSCGFSNEPGEKFCGGCGQPVRASQSPAAKFVAPQSYTPKHLAERILTSKAALEGERKQVTVLFADLKGSMELLAGRDPEEARKLLDPVLELMIEAVHRYEGTVNQVMGDGIMALFGAPLAHEDHAVRACYAALRMQAAVKQYAAKSRTDGVPIQIRVGLNSGEVVVRSISNDLHMDYTAVGQTTHLAARMEQLADPATILLTSATRQLVEGYVEVVDRGPVAVKGLAAPVEVSKLVGAGPIRSRLQVSAARGLTRFVARDYEMEQLRLALERAGEGHGQVVGVVGEPGVGKSRLYWEFLQSPRTTGWLVLESRSVSYGMATSYLPVIELLKRYFEIEAPDEPHRMREKVTSKLVSLDEALRPSLPAFLALLDLPVDDATWQVLDPPQRRQRMVNAVKLLLLRESRVQPVLLVFEDLHWIDAETQGLLDSLVESLPAARLLFLISYRPEYQHGWGSKTYYRQLQIDPLPPHSAEPLLVSLLGDDASLPSLKSLLIERTEGNPFFLEESVRDLFETGALSGERGAYRLVAPLPSIQAPATVQTVVAARIDRLAPDEKRLLQSAAVIGKDVPSGLLQAIADLSEPDFQRSLRHLQAAEFVYETSAFPESEYSFKHALTHEVAYGSLLNKRRRDLHARVTHAIENVYADRLDQHAERLAHHAEQGELWEQAARYGQLAGTQALLRSATGEAIERYRAALASLSHLPDDEATIRRRIDLLKRLRVPLWQLGRMGEVLEVLQEVERLARETGDEERRLWAIVSLFNAFWLIGGHDQAMQLLAEVQRAAETAADPGLRIVAAIQIGQTLISRIGEYGRMRNLLTPCLGITGSAVGQHPVGRTPNHSSALLRALLAGAAAYLGEFNEGLAHAEKELELAETGGPLERVYVLGFLATLHNWRCDFGRALSSSAVAVSLIEEYALDVAFAGLLSVHGVALCGVGKVEEGVSFAERAVKTAEASGLLYWYGIWVMNLAESHLLASQAERSRDTAASALELSRARGDTFIEAWARAVIADATLAIGSSEVETVKIAYEDSIALATELNLRPLMVRGHAGLGKLSQRTGDLEQARKHLGTAIAMYREMGMTQRLEQAESELKGLA